MSTGLQNHDVKNLKDRKLASSYFLFWLMYYYYIILLSAIGCHPVNTQWLIDMM